MLQYQYMCKRGELVELFDIAGLKVAMECKDGMLYERSRAYLAKDQREEPDFSVVIPDEILQKKHEALPQLTLDECRYVYMGEGFYHKILNFDGMLLHASAIEKDGKAYLFSARSGTGKSTHTHLWMKQFDGVRMINDDKPALRYIDGTLCACGTPFSGKNDESSNICVPVRAIVFVERAEENKIECISAKDAIPLFISQTVRPAAEKYAVKSLEMLDRVLKEVPVFRLRCNMLPEAAICAYEGIENYFKEVDKNEN